jgi:hypothetical protein
MLRRLRTICIVYKFQILTGFLVLAALEAGLLMVESTKIKQEIAGRIESSLQQRGFGRIDVSVSGRDVILHGEVSSQTGESHAVDISGAAVGVREVTSRLDLRALRLPHLIVNRNLGNDLKVSGEFPVQTQADRISDMLVTAIRHDTYENSLIVNPEVTDPGWVDLAQGVFREANMLTGIEIEIGAGKLALGGLVDRQSDYNVLILRIEQFMADSGLEFINRVGIRPAVALALQEWTRSPPGEFQEATDSEILPGQ